MVSRPPTEEELVERARAGDGAAFGTLVRDHQEIAFRTAYLITRNAADAEDAAQSALVKAFSALPRFRRGAPFRPWLLAIVANEARNRRRSAGRRDASRCALRTKFPGGRGSVSRGGSDRGRGAREPARGAGDAAGGSGSSSRALPARPERGGDCGGARRAARDGQVAHGAGARAAARADRGVPA